jgi:hypothetical protein
MSTKKTATAKKSTPKTENAKASTTNAITPKATPKKGATPQVEADTQATASRSKKDKPAAEKADPKMSALDAAAKVLGESTEPMASKAMIDAMSTKGYWTSPGGKTPHATLYAAILREINVKGAEARFKKTDRGLFASTGKE